MEDDSGIASADDNGADILRRAPKPAQPMIEGARCVLVPYQREHVPTYHQWMQQQHLLDLTASERLSLEQEYANQLSWTIDPTKVTFIILDRSLPLSPPHTALGSHAMVGDVNLFMHDWFDPHTGELEVMIARDDSKRTGLAHEAITLMMDYARAALGIHTFIAKIGAANEASLRLFRDKLGFTMADYSDAFKEHELVLWCQCQPCQHQRHGSGDAANM